MSTQVGASDYQAIGDPRVDLPQFAATLAALGCTHTRVWLIDAWATGAGETGTYGGYLPMTKRSDGVWNLDDWRTDYFERVREFAESMNAVGIAPTFTLLELYSWSERKQGLQWVPDQNRGPFRKNISGVRWGDPDDPTFFTLPDAWMRAFIQQVSTTLQGTDYALELGNEMPEKPMHQRLRDWVRSLGYTGLVQVNRQEDTPGQYANMQIGTAYDRIAFHGKRDISYLTEDFPNEPTFRTFDEFYRSGPDFSRIVLSSDGCRKTTNVADAYDYPALEVVAQDILSRGGWYEHQLCVKLRRFTHGTYDLGDIAFDAPFLRALTGSTAPLPGPTPGPTPTPPVTYFPFVAPFAQQVHDKYLAVHGHEPAPSDLYHVAWQVLREGLTLEQALAGIHL